MKSLMEQEIFEQPSIFEEVVKKCVEGDKILIDFPESYKKIHFVASGSSYNCARMAENFFKDIGGFDTLCDFSSEFLANKLNKIEKDTLYFFISQSGETSDTIAVMNKVHEMGAKTYALVNVENSKMYQMADYKLCVGAGVERAVAATKSYSVCLLYCYLLAVKFSDVPSKYLKSLDKIKHYAEDFLKNLDKIEECAKLLSTQRGFPIIGYNYYYILGKEGSLKIKETSYIDANAYPLGEFVHGHIALLNEEHIVVEIYDSDMGEFEIKNLKKVRDDYNPKIISISDKKAFEGELNITIPKCENPILKYLLIVLSLQILALKIAENIGRDIDKPNGLKKVVV